MCANASYQLNSTLGPVLERVEGRDEITTEVIPEKAISHPLPGSALRNTMRFAGEHAPTMLVPPKVSIIIPVYNEQERIADCLNRAKSHLRFLGAPYEIVVVDDGSTDMTGITVQRIADGETVKAVGYRYNRGKGFAIRYGANYVSGEIVVLMDGDGDISPNLVDRYVAVLKDHDVALASKRHPESRVSSPVVRKFLSLTFRVLVGLSTGLGMSDTQSGFKAFRREPLGRIMKLICVKQYAFDVELLVVAKLLKLRVAELPIVIKLDKPFSVRHALRMAVDLMGIAYRLWILRWYQTNLQNTTARYEPILNW